MENLEMNKNEQVIENDSELSEKTQSAEDKVRTEYTKKIKALEDKLQALEQKEKEIARKEKEIARKEKEIARKEMEIKVSEILNKNGLPQQLSKYLNIEGVEDVESYLGEIKEVLGSQMQQTTYYKPNAHKGQTEGITKEQFNKMSYADRLNLFQNNLELYKQLSK